MDKPVRIIGCMRSGTLYTTKVLRRCGLNVGHEYSDTDGTVSAFALGNTELLPPFTNKNKEDIKPEGRCPHINEDVDGIDWKVTLHQVRNPLDCIASNFVVMLAFMYPYLNSVCQEIPEKRVINKLQRCMLYWYYWNLECEHRSKFTYQVEQMEQRWDEISAELGVDRKFPHLISKTTNRALRNTKQFVDREFKIESVDVLYEQDHDLTVKIIELANKYGYKL